MRLIEIGTLHTQQAPRIRAGPRAPPRGTDTHKHMSSWVLFGCLFGSLGVLLGRSWALLGRSRAALEEYDFLLIIFGPIFAPTWLHFDPQNGTKIGAKTDQKR